MSFEVEGGIQIPARPVRYPFADQAVFLSPAIKTDERLS
jgi:hypothetical protein